MSEVEWMIRLLDLGVSAILGVALILFITFLNRGINVVREVIIVIRGSEEADSAERKGLFTLIETLTTRWVTTIEQLSTLVENVDVRANQRFEIAMEKMEGVPSVLSGLQGEVSQSYQLLLDIQVQLNEIKEDLDQLPQTADLQQLKECINSLNTNVTQLVKGIKKQADQPQEEEKADDERIERPVELDEQPVTGRSERGPADAGGPGERADPGPDRNVRDVASQE